MSQLNNNCESALTCFEALPLALKENKSGGGSMCVRRFAPTCVCGSRLMPDHLEESGNSVFHVEWTRVVA